MSDITTHILEAEMTYASSPSLDPPAYDAEVDPDPRIGELETEIEHLQRRLQAHITLVEAERDATDAGRGSFSLGTGAYWAHEGKYWALRSIALRLRALEGH